MKTIIKYRFWILAITIVSACISSCAVDNRSYTTQMHQLPTELPLTDVCLANNAIYVAAGDLFTVGLLLKSMDQGATWDTVSTYSQGLNSLSFTNGILSVSESGRKFHTTTDFVNWSTEQATFGWWDWHSHLRLNDNRVLLVGGVNFGRGYLHTKKPNETTFSLQDTFFHEIRDLVQTPNRMLHAVGYGVVLKSIDEGYSWSVDDVYGDFFRGVDFPSDEIGYVVGEHGVVYKTTNRGDSWQKCRGGNTVFPNPDRQFRDVAFWDEENGFIVGTGNLAYRTDDGGAVWKEINNWDGYGNFTRIRIFDNKAYLTAEVGQLLIVNLE